MHSTGLERPRSGRRKQRTCQPRSGWRGLCRLDLWRRCPPQTPKPDPLSGPQRQCRNQIFVMAGNRSSLTMRGGACDGTLARDVPLGSRSLHTFSKNSNKALWPRSSNDLRWRATKSHHAVNDGLSVDMLRQTSKRLGCQAQVHVSVADDRSTEKKHFTVSVEGMILHRKIASVVRCERQLVCFGF